jgi:hypothetical protein
LHGHDFWILGQSDQPYDPATFKPVTKNPPRRDVAMLPSGGFVLIAFENDNPGAWLLHCHIGWHVAKGFALTFLEQRENLKIDNATLNGNCDNWKKFAADQKIVQQDSGV